MGKTIKLYRVNSADTPLCCDERGAIDGLLQCLIEDNRFQIVESPDLADFILMKERFGAKNQKYLKSVLGCEFLRRYHNKIITLNFDTNPNGIFRGLYTTLRRSRCVKDRHLVIPYLRYPNEHVLERAGSNLENEPKVLCSFRGNLKSHPMRREIFDVLDGKPDFDLQSTESWFDHEDLEKQEYVDSILRAKFVLCPGGYAATSYRVQEVMALGRVPVIISDDFPQYAVFDPLSVCLVVPQNKIRNLESIIKACEKDWEAMASACYNEWLKIEPEKVIQTIGKTLREFLLAYRAPSLEEQKFYWNSCKFKKKNQWRFVDKLKIRIEQLLRIKKSW